MYDFQTLKDAILFNTQEVLPTNEEQLNTEIQALVDAANASGEKIRHYVGFEISGQIHFPGSVYLMLQVAELQKAGVECHIWLADYHTWINKKLDGNIETIQKVATEYFAPVMKKALEVAGGNPDELGVLFAKDEYFKANNKGLHFWDYEFECDSQLTLNRVVRSLSAAGKSASDGIDYQVTRYPGMQAADVFWLNMHIAQSSLDQRKIYVSCRDMAQKIDPDFQLSLGNAKVKPITTFSTLLLGLGKPVEKQDGDFTVLEVNKMSKSKPETCIFVHDDAASIKKKIKKGYCPMPQATQSPEEIEKEQEMNPMLNWAQHFIFKAGKHIPITRPDEYGGNTSYSDYTSLYTDYISGELHPGDLKNGIAECLVEWFTPIRAWAEAHPENLKLVQSFAKKK